MQRLVDVVRCDNGGMVCGDVGRELCMMVSDEWCGEMCNAVWGCGNVWPTLSHRNATYRMLNM